MEDYAEHPRTVILSTHLIDEVSNLLEHVLVIDKGKLIIDQDAEELRGRAFTVTGQAAKVEAFLIGKETVHREPFGGLLSATVIRSQNGSDHKQAAASGLEISPVSLQQLVVHLTNGKSEQKGAVATMNRISSVLKLHYRDKWSWIYIPALILFSSFAVNLIVSS